MISPATRILLRSLLKPFFRENGGLMLFLLFIMFAAVGHNNGVGLRAYHYSLITGMLTKTDMLLLVLAAWMLYGLRSASFIRRSLVQPSFSFLSEFARLRKFALYSKLLLLQLIIFSPVLIYAAIILVISIRLQLYGRTAGLTAVLAALCFGMPALYTHLFSHPGLLRANGEKRKPRASFSSSYRQLLVRFLLTQKKILLLFVKGFSVVMLLAVLQPMSTEYTDMRMPVLFFSFGALGHSVLLFQIREMEERGLGFYRGLPVSLWNRFRAYLLFYALLFLPETAVLVLMMPGRLGAGAALLLYGLGLGLLLLMNSILFTGHFTKTGFLKICCGIYLMIFIGVLSGFIALVVTVLVFVSVLLFFRAYYRLDPSAG